MTAERAEATQELNLGLLCYVAYRAVETRVIAAVRSAGFDDITVAQARLFARIDPDGTRLTDLAEQAQVTKQTAGFLVDQLERCGYVSREPDPADARARLVRIAPRGLAAVEVARRAEAEVEAEWTRHLGRQATAGLPRALSRLRGVTDEEWGGADPAYMTHLLAHGRVVVGVAGGSVAGFGATRPLGSGPGAVSMLCDLFVHPEVHGSGCGRAMLAALWPGTRGHRMTFSSLHAHALPLYTSFGLDAWWPLLYLRGRVDALAVPAGWQAAAASPASVAAAELSWTGVDRSADHQAWARRPGGAGVLAVRDGEVMAAGTVGGAGGEVGWIYSAL